MRCPKRGKRSDLPVKYCGHKSAHGAKPESKLWQQYPTQPYKRLVSKDFAPSASLHWDGSAWAGEIALARELGALGALPSVISPSKVQL